MQSDKEIKSKVSNQHQNRRRRKAAMSARVILGASLLSVVIGVVLVGGLLYGAYAATGHSVGGHAPVTASGDKPLQGTGNSTTPTSGSRQTSQQTADLPKSIRLVALGDSLTHGFGDASGAGYVGDVVQQLRHQGRQVTQTNLGVDGLTSGGLLKQIQRTQVQQDIRNANLILISIGGNDLNDAAGLPNINAQRVSTAQRQFNNNLEHILKSIRIWNPSSPVLLIGLYNPYGSIAQVHTETNQIVQEWDADELKLVGSFHNVVVVQTYDLFELNPDKLLYIDHFHPNESGYRLIANRVWQDLQGIANTVGTGT